MNFKALGRSVLAALAVLLAIARPATAGVFSFTNATGSADFNTGGNWDPNASAPPGSADTAVYSNGTYTVNFQTTVTNDRMQVLTSTMTTFTLNGNSYVLLNNGGGSLVFGDVAGTGSALIIDGGTVQVPAGEANLYPNVTVQNGGTLKFTSGGTTYGAGALLTVEGSGSAFTTPSGLNRVMLTVTNGASASISGNVFVGYRGDRMWVGGGSGTSTLTVGNRVLSEPIESGSLVVRPGGVLNATNGIEASVNGGFGMIITMTNGTVGIGTGTNLFIGHSGTVDSVLRGTGLLKRLGGSGQFSVVNEGLIRPGDVGASYDVNTPALGTLTLQNGDLFQTNAAVTTAGLRFEFNPSVAGSADLIDLGTTGNAIITAGSNVFATITGSTLTFGKWDFIKATVITNSPAYDNLASIINGMTNAFALANLDFAGYSYGVVNLPGGGQALELSINMIPEPSTILLLLGGGLLVWRMRRGKR